MTIRQHVTQVDGRDIRWCSAGSGSPTIVLEAGLTASASQWTKILPRLAAKTQVVAVSRAGYGGSSPARRRPASATVADLGAVLAEVGGPLILVGHSWGGLVARLFTASHPERVQGLVLVDATHEALAPMRTLRARLLGQLAMSYVLIRAHTGRLRRDLQQGRGPLGAALVHAGEDRPALIEEMADPQTWRQARRDHWAIAPTLRALHQSPLLTPRVPVVALVGALGKGRQAEARKAVIETYEGWLPAMPQGRLILAPNSGHLVPHDDEDLLVQVVTDLLAEVRDLHKGCQ